MRDLGRCELSSLRPLPGGETGRSLELHEVAGGTNQLQSTQKKEPGKKTTLGYRGGVKKSISFATDPGVKRGGEIS